jgi:peptide deformylase
VGILLTMADIVKEGQPILRERASEVKLPPTDEDLVTLKEMTTFLKNSQTPEIAEKYNLRPGVGLAAPQIGVNKRMIAVLVEDDNGRLYDYGLFNPRIVSHSVEKAYLQSGEGCLSVDRPVPGFVPRYARITVKGTDIDGTEVSLRLRGLPGIVFQHEIDHLNGVMFYDHIDKQDPFKVPENSTAIDRA